jgi:hypothetical protein
LKRLILIAALLCTLLGGQAKAQETGPLAMQIMFEWTAAGGIGGGLIGFALWLTDPGNPNTRLSEQMTKGAALGIILGAGYGLFVLQRSAQIPYRTQVEVRDPLNPTRRITSDPVAIASGDFRGLGIANASSPAESFLQLPLFNIHF